jgi:hypothetical protein
LIVAAPANQEVTTNRDYISMNPDFSECSTNGVMASLRAADYWENQVKRNRRQVLHYHVC